MSVKNTGHLLLDRILKEKRQHRNECSNETRKSNNVERKKNILKRIVSKTDKDSRISLSIKYRLSIKRKRRIKIQEKTNR